MSEDNVGNGYYRWFSDDKRETHLAAKEDISQCIWTLFFNFKTTKYMLIFWGNGLGKALKFNIINNKVIDHPNRS
jgi:hypothetical protein